MILHHPAHPNGTAVIVISGGGYRTIERGQESGPTALWLARKGVTAIELIYRLPDLMPEMHIFRHGGHG